MAGKSGKSGREALPGHVYRLNVRFLPTRHSPELAELLEILAAASPQNRADILDSLAVGGLAAVRAKPIVKLSTQNLLDDLFG